MLPNGITSSFECNLSHILILKIFIMKLCSISLTKINSTHQSTVLQLNSELQIINCKIVNFLFKMTSDSCFGTGLNFPFGQKNKEIDEFQLYNQRKKKLKLPKNIEKFFRILQEIRKIGYSKAIKKQTSVEIQNQILSFYNTFNYLSTTEKNHYLLQLIIEADRRIYDRELQPQKNITIETFSINDTFKDSDKYLQSKCRFCSASEKTLGIIKNWHQSIIKLNKHKKRLTVKVKNSLFHLPLRSYVVRLKKQQFTFALMSTHQFEERNLKVLLFQFEPNNKQKFVQLYRNVLDVIVSYQIDKLMMQNFFDEKFNSLDDARKNKIRLYLSEASIKKCVDRINSLQKSSNNQKNQEKIVLQENHQNNQTLIINEYRNKEGIWYEGEAEIYDRHDTKQINFLEIYHSSHKYLAKFNILQTCYQESLESYTLNQEDEKFCALFQKLKIGEKLYCQDIFVKKIKRKEQNEQVFYFIGLDHQFNQNFIEIMKITLSPSNKNPDSYFTLKIIVKFGQTFSNSKQGEEKLIQFVKEFYFMFQRLKNCNSSDGNEIHNQEINSKFFVEKDLISRFQTEQHPMEFSKQSQRPSKINAFIKRLSVADIPEYAFLRRRHRQIPTAQKIGKLMNEHFLYKQWQRLPKGGLKCTNYELVAFQKSLYKTVIKKFGQNLIMGRNIINFSLPVVCFKKESHLQSLAQSMCYCPIFLEKAAKIQDPLQKMKYSVVIMIATGILTVQSEKPFNPILGETYQGYVDGCPVYMEQLSHHPPISAYFMVGRGYKMYGCVEPRISLHFNGATGYSNLPHYIQFQDGTIIELIFAKITITGMMFGDREFYFEDKIYAFDKTNNLFAELIFGPFKNGSLFSSSSEPQDYFHGKVYEVTENFKTEFDKSSPRIYPGKNDIVKEHLMFDGIWSGSIHIDGEEIINFKTDLPYEFVEEEYPIPSDSRYRKDLQKLAEGDKEEAQRFKQLLQEEQRRDKKLRNQQ